MSASTTDLFTKVGLPGSATTLESPGYTIGDASINLASTTNWPTDSLICFAIDRAEIINGETVRIAGTYNEFSGIVTGAGVIESLVHEFGPAQDYAAGALTRVYIPVSPTRENKMVEGLEVEHNKNGTHKAVTATSVTTTGDITAGGAVKSDTISEKTSGHGVEVDQLLIKDKALTNLSNPYKFSAYANSAWVWGSNDYAKVPLNAETFDTNSNFDSATNYRYTAPVDGFYQVDARAKGDQVSGGGQQIAVYKNGSSIIEGGTVPFGYSGVFGTSLGASKLIQLAAGDYIELFAYGSGQAGHTGASKTYMSAFLVSTT
jgi:hypothetical protein